MDSITCGLIAGAAGTAVLNITTDLDDHLGATPWLTADETC
jgi:hypothetical protein